MRRLVIERRVGWVTDSGDPADIARVLADATGARGDESLENRVRVAAAELNWSARARQADRPVREAGAVTVPLFASRAAIEPLLPEIAERQRAVLEGGRYILGPRGRGVRDGVR